MNIKEELESLYKSAKADGDLRLAFDILVFYAHNSLRVNINSSHTTLKDAVSSQEVPRGYIWDYIGKSG